MGAACGVPPAVFSDSRSTLGACRACPPFAWPIHCALCALIVSQPANLSRPAWRLAPTCWTPLPCLPHPQLCMEWALAEEAAGNLGALLPCRCCFAAFAAAEPPLLPASSCCFTSAAAAAAGAAADVLRDRLLPAAHLPAASVFFRPSALSATSFPPSPRLFPIPQAMRCRFSSRAPPPLRNHMRRCCKLGPPWHAAWGALSWQTALRGSWRRCCAPASWRDLD